MSKEFIELSKAIEIEDAKLRYVKLVRASLVATMTRVVASIEADAQLEVLKELVPEETQWPETLEGKPGDGPQSDS